MLRPALALAVLALALAPAPGRAAELPGRAIGMYAPAGAPLAMQDSELDVTVHGAIVEATVQQTFRNDTDQPTEATYIFPLPADAAVTAMAMKIGGTTIHAAIELRQRAAERYERALAQGAPAAVLDQERPDVFTQSVAAIPAHGTVEVTLRFDTTARYEAGRWELVLPLVVAPRFVPGSATGRPVTGAGKAPDTDRAPDASHVTPPSSPDAGGKTTIRLHFDGEIADLASPTHTIDGTTIVDPHSDHDAVIRWRAKLPEAAFVEPDGFAAVVVQAPPAEPRPRTAALHARLVLDRSATTRGDGDVIERPLVHALLAALGPADRIAVAGSDTLDARTPDEARRALDDRWAQAAPRFDLASVLAEVHTREPVVLITDGLVADDAAVIAAARKLGAPVHVLGIGPAPNRSLLVAIAAATDGTVRFVVPGDDLPQIARDVVGDAASPPRPLALTWGTLGASDVVPAQMPRLGAGQAALVLARVKRAAPGNARVFGDVFGFTAIAPGKPPEGALTPLGPLGRRWARGKLDELVAAGNPRAIADHALRYGLVSPQTSMVAIGDATIVQGGIKHTVAVPVSVPAGMRWQLVEQATHVDTSTTERDFEPKPAPKSESKAGDVTMKKPGRAKDDRGGDEDLDGARAHKHEPTKGSPKSATRSDDDGAEGGEAEVRLAPAAPTVDIGERVSEESLVTSSTSGRRLRLSAALGAGLHVVNGDAAALGGLSLRADTGRHFLFGVEGSLWLVGGLHAEGSLLATATRRGNAHRLELGAGAGLRITGSAVGPALDFALRFPLAPALRLFLRYDGALLLHGGTFDGENAGSLGVEASW